MGPTCLGYMFAAGILGSIVYVWFRKKAEWEKGEFSIVFAFLPANVLFINFLSIYSLLSYPLFVARGGENDPIWVLALFAISLYSSLLFGSLGSFLLIFRALKKLSTSSEKIQFSQKLLKTTIIASISIFGTLSPVIIWKYFNFFNVWPLPC